MTDSTHRMVDPGKPYRVFLSYRHSGNPFVASSIRDRLLGTLGAGNVLMDEDFLIGGDPLNVLRRAVESCDALLVVMHPGWLTEIHRRLDQPDDWVRMEVATALALGIPVLPVVLHDAPIPRREELPGDLAELAERKFLRLRPHMDFAADMEKLLHHVEANAGDYREARRTLTLLEDAWDRGEWIAAYRHLRQALVEPRIGRTPLRVQLAERLKDATRLAAAEEAAAKGRFSEVLKHLDGLRTQRPMVEATREVAKIGVRLAEALSCGDLQNMDRLEWELGEHDRQAAGSSIPGSKHLAELLVLAKRIRDEVWRALDIQASESADFDWLLARYAPAFIELIANRSLKISISTLVGFDAFEQVLSYSEVGLFSDPKMTVIAPESLPIADAYEWVLSDRGVKARTIKARGWVHPLWTDIELPGGRIDNVRFTVTSPPAVAPGSRFVIAVWAHLAAGRDDVLALARQAVDEVIPRTTGPFRLRTSNLLAVQLKIAGLTVEDSVATILWDGEIGNAGFLVLVPEHAVAGFRWATATILVDGLRIVNIDFVVRIGPASDDVRPASTREQRYRSALACYASRDRREVLARVQGMRKIAPYLEVFVDVLKLRSAEWEEELSRRILLSEVFYLFWSEAASCARWVQREWRYALEMRGIDFIDPVPLVSPERVPPPPELAAEHSDDWLLAYLQVASTKQPLPSSRSRSQKVEHA